MKALSGESRAGLRSLPEYLGRVLAACPVCGEGGRGTGQDQREGRSRPTYSCSGGYNTECLTLNDLSIMLINTTSKTPVGLAPTFPSANGPDLN